MFSTQEDLEFTPRDDFENSIIMSAKKFRNDCMSQSPARKRNKGRSTLCLTGTKAENQFTLLDLNGTSNLSQPASQGLGEILHHSDSNESTNSFRFTQTVTGGNPSFPSFMNFSQDSNMSFSQDVTDRLSTMQMNSFSQDDLIRSTSVLGNDSFNLERKDSENSNCLFRTPSLPTNRGSMKDMNKGKRSISSIFNQLNQPMNQNIDQNACPNRMMTRSLTKGSGCKNKSDNNHLPAISTPTESAEKQYELPPVVLNPFITNRVGSAEHYFQNYLSLPPSSSQAKGKAQRGGRAAAAKSKQPSMLWISPYKERPRYYTDFEEILMLGEGTFSVVHCVRHRTDGMLYAIKKIKEPIRSTKQRQLILKEVHLLSYLNTIHCPNIIQYYSNWIYEDRLYIQTELCHLGSLEDLISAIPSKTSIMRACFSCKDINEVEKVFLSSPALVSADSYQPSAVGSQFGSQAESEQQNFGLHSMINHGSSINSHFPLNIPDICIREELAWKILKEMSQTLSFLHSRGFVHLDIRPANIFLQMNYEKSHHNPFAFKASFTGEGSQLSRDGSQMSRASTNSNISVGESLFSNILKAKPLQLGFSSTYDSFSLQQKKEEDDNTRYANVRHKIEEAIIESKFNLKLGDFGHCRHIDDDSIIIEGETRYCPKELIVDDWQDGIASSTAKSLDLTKCDIFSLGASIYELCLGKFLQNNRDEDDMKAWHELRSGIVDKEFETKYSQNFVSMIKCMLAADPTLRPSANSLFEKSCLRS